MMNFRRLFGVMMGLLLGALLLASPAHARREVVVTHTNIAPVNKCGTLENQIQGAIDQFKLDAADAASLREQIMNNGGTAVTHAVGTQYDYYTQCRNGKVVNVGGTGDVIVWKGKEALAARSYTLPSGRVIDRVLSCGNWTSGRYVPPPPPPVQTTPPPPPPVPPTTFVPPVPPVAEVIKRGLCEEIDGTVTVGFESQIRRQGRGNTVYYGTASVDCHFKRLKNGWLGAGATIDASTYKGNTKAKFGRYSGSEMYAGPSLHYVDDSGWDVRGTVQIGFRKGQYQQDDGYSNKRSNTMLGLGVQYNDNRYLTTGKGTEFNLWAHCGLPVGGKSSEYRNKQRTGNGAKLVGTCGIGGRKYLSNGKVRPYLQANLHGEANKGGDDYLNAGLRVGVEFNNFAYCGIGVDIGLINGGTNAAFGCGISINGSIRAKRTATRASAIVNNE